MMVAGYKLVPSNGTRPAAGHDGVRIATYPRSLPGERLRNLRVALGLSLRDAAKRFGMDALAYGRLERGAAECDWNDADRLLMRWP